MIETADWVFDDMDGKFDARLRRVFPTTRSMTNGEREIVVTNSVATIEAKFDFATLDRLYSPNFVAIERQVEGKRSHLIFEVVGVNPIHFQMLGMDVSMPTVLRREYLDTISESWGRSQETWIDMSAVPTWYSMTDDGGEPRFERSRLLPLAGARVHLLSKKAVERFLCFNRGEVVGTMVGFDLPLTINLENLIRFHGAVFGFSVDHDEPIIYRRKGLVQIGKIGELVDGFYENNQGGPIRTSSIEVVCFDRDSLEIKWSPIQYVFRHKYEGKLLRFRLATGRNVAVTPSHSLFVLKDGVIQSVPASTIKRGDYVIGPREIPTSDGGNVIIDLVRFFSGSNGIVLRHLPRESIPSGILRASKNKEWYWRSKGMVPISRAYLLQAEDIAKATISYKRCAYDLPVALEIDKPMARLLGYYLAEGHIKWIPGKQYAVEFTLSKKDERILEDIRLIFASKFGITPRTVRHGENGIRVTVCHKSLVEVFAKLVGIGAGKKTVPKEILNSPTSVRRAFLLSWVEGDYGVTVSRRLMNDMMYLLLMENCVATSSEWTYKEPVVIEGRRVSSKLRYQMKFPKADELLGGEFRLARRTREPIYPTSEIPASVCSLYTKSSLAGRQKLVTPKLMETLESKISQLQSYSNTTQKSGAETRQDGFYRANVGKFFVKEGAKIKSNQLLVGLPESLERLRHIVESKLSFLKVIDIESVDPSSEYVYDVSVPGAENFLAGFGGVFCHNTGVGKSNLTSVLLRKVMKAYDDITTVVLDVSGEYTTHLIDLVKSDGRILSYEPIEDEQQLYGSQVIPESLEESVSEAAIRRIYASLLKEGRVQTLSVGSGTSALDLAAVEDLLTKTAEEGKSGAIAAKIGLEKLSGTFFRELKLSRSAKISELADEPRKQLLALLDAIREKTNERTSLRSEIEAIIDYMDAAPEEDSGGESNNLTPEQLAWNIVSGKAPKLNILYLPDPVEARWVVSRLITRVLNLRKKHGSGKKILIVLDEAQEYIPDNPRDKDGTQASNLAVEALLRQGRKYRVHCWLATQRVARLNVSALQQVHSYFVSTLPRFYDRMVIADSFALPYEVLERTAQLDTGEWIFVSYKATRQKNVPVFIRTENNESIVAAFLKA